MELATWQAPSGESAVLAFSSWPELAAWAAEAGIDARPVPVPAAELLAAAAAEGHAALILDAAGDSPFTLTRDELLALARGYVPVVGVEGVSARMAPGTPRPASWSVPPALVRTLAADPGVVEAWPLLIDDADPSGSPLRILGLLLAGEATPWAVASRLTSVADSEVMMTLVTAAQVANWRSAGHRPL